jgi:hypothetical protein
MKTSSWTLALGACALSDRKFQIRLLPPVPFRRNGSRKSEKDPQAFKHNLYSLFGPGAVLVTLYGYVSHSYFRPSVTN